MLEYLALGMLLLSITAIFYIFIFIHDLPHRMAKKRNHPQAEAIHYACWLSLFTLHAIWPLVFIWSVSNREPVRVTVDGSDNAAPSTPADLATEIANLKARLAKLEARTNGKEASHG